MISHELRVSGFDTEDWRRLAQLAVPFRSKQAQVGPTKPRSTGALFIVRSGSGVHKVLHSRWGRIPLRPTMRRADLAQWCERYRAGFGVEVELGALDDLAEDFARGLRPEHDLMRQLLDLLTLARELEAHDRLKAWPRRLASLPTWSEGSLQLGIEALCPVGHAIVIGVFDRGGLFSSLILHRGKDGIDLLLGPAELRAEAGLLSGDFRRDYRHLLSSAERLVAPVALGLFCELRTLERLDLKRPGALTEAVLLREVILTPTSRAATFGLGVDVGRVALSGFRALARRASIIDLSNLRLPEALSHDPLGFLQRFLKKDPRDD